MNKELPKMYQSKINRDVPSIQKVYSTLDKRTLSSEDEVLDRSYSNKRYSSMSIEKKIDNIFNSPDYVYKADVTIVTDGETLKRRVVARNRNNIITIDNEYIPISIIRDIYK